MSTKPAPRPRLVFVYNADSGIGAALFDSVHKIVSPATYGCSLCAVTYGPLRMRREWRNWLRAAPFNARFLHRDELMRAYPDLNLPLPAILVERDGSPRLLLGPAALDSLRTLGALIGRIETVLGKADSSA